MSQFPGQDQNGRYPDDWFTPGGGRDRYEASRRRDSGGPYVEGGTLYEHGNQRVLQPHEVADAQKYANDYWSQGHMPSPTNGPGGSSRPPILQQPGVDPTSGGRWLQGTQFNGFQPKYAMEGFDTGRLQDTGKSAKDAFAWLSQQAPPPPIHDKAALQVWFQTHIQPGMDRLGHKVLEVKEDKFRFSNWQGDGQGWVDFARGSGAQGGALSWQPDAVMGGPASQSYNHTQQAIMGVPRPTPQNGGSVSSAVLAPMQPQQAPGNPDMDAYYQYLQQLMQQESI